MASTLSNLLYHIVFSTKGREPLIAANLAPDLHRYLAGIIQNDAGIPLEIGGMTDHVHLFFKMRADVSLADSVRILKANSSRWAAERIPNFAWQTGYGAFTVSASQVESVRSYIRNQAEHHRIVSFQDEFRAFLARHGIEYDERYVWG